MYVAPCRGVHGVRCQYRKPETKSNKENSSSSHKQRHTRIASQGHRLVLYAGQGRTQTSGLKRGTSCYWCVTTRDALNYAVPSMDNRMELSCPIRLAREERGLALGNLAPAA